MAYVNPLDQTTPFGTDLVSAGALRIRETKGALIERIQSFFVSTEDNPWVNIVGAKVNTVAANAATSDLGTSANPFQDIWLARTLNIVQGAITADAQAISTSATWNNVAITFTHWKIAVTDTTSAAASLLVNFLVGGVSQFSVSKTGLVNGLVVGFGAGLVATNTAIGGVGTLSANTTGSLNVAVGYAAMNLSTTGKWNTAVGANALDGICGNGNVAIGTSSQLQGAGAQNNSVGAFSLQGVTGSNNIGIGYQALLNITSGGTNTTVGNYTVCDSNTTGSGNVALGFSAGRYETGSNAFYIDNQDRTSTASDKAKALLYGIFDAAAANQRLTINAHVGIGGPATTASQFHITGLPTSAAGLAAGDIWANSGVLTVV